MARYEIGLVLGGHMIVEAGRAEVTDAGHLVLVETYHAGLPTVGPEAAFAPGQWAYVVDLDAKEEKDTSE